MISDLPTPRAMCAACKVDGIIYVIGGSSNGIPSGAVSAVEKYTPSSTLVDEHWQSQPNEFVLYQNYPNPFNPQTVISFTLPKTSFVQLRVFNILGNEIETILNKKITGGFYEIKWTPKNLSGGTYFYQLQSDEFRETKRLIFQK